MFKIYNWWQKKKFLADQITENIIESEIEKDLFDSVFGGINWLQSSNKHPPNPKEGDAYYNEADQKMYVYSSSDKKWYEIGDTI